MGPFNRTATLLVGLLLAACAAPEPRAEPVAPGLVALPCRDGPLRPHWSFYCQARRNYVTTDAKAALDRTAASFARKHPGAAIRYLEGSWPRGTRPMPPHFSHGDGRQLDIALFYTDRKGRPLGKPPTTNGYRAYEPPRQRDVRACTGAQRRPALQDGADPPVGRRWRLDEDRTRDLVALLAADPKVRRIFIEPHLKARLGFARNSKVRFAGCRAARHDDHLHVDFF